MKISYVSVSRVSKVLALSLALGISSVAFAADDMSDQYLTDLIRTNNAGVLSTKSALKFQSVELTGYNADEVTSASSRNLGHQMMSLREQFSAELSWLNNLQDAALKEDSSFIQMLSDQAYGAFNWVFSIATSDRKAKTIATESVKVARQCWLLSTLVDYGITSQAYRLIKASANDKLSKSIEDEAILLDSKLLENKTEKEKEKTARLQGFSEAEVELQSQKTSLEKLLNAESNAARKQDTAARVQELDVELKKLDSDRNNYKLLVESEVAALELACTQRKQEMADQKVDALKNLETKYSYIFEQLGSTGGKTFSRWLTGRPSIRSEYPEFAELDKMISNDYPELPQIARNSVLDELFSRISASESVSVEEALLRAGVLRGLLNIPLGEYGEITKRVHAKEVAKNAELTAKATEGQTQIQQTIAASASPQAESSAVSAIIPIAPTPEEASVVGKVANFTSSVLEGKKKEVSDASAESEPKDSLSVPINAVPTPFVSALLSGGHRLADGNGSDNSQGLRNRFPAASAALSEPDQTAPRAATPVEIRPAASSSSSSSAHGAQKKNKGKRRR